MLIKYLLDQGVAIRPHCCRILTYLPQVSRLRRPSPTHRLWPHRPVQPKGAAIRSWTEGIRRPELSRLGSGPSGSGAGGDGPACALYRRDFAGCHCPGNARHRRGAEGRVTMGSRCRQGGLVPTVAVDPGPSGPAPAGSLQLGCSTRGAGDAVIGRLKTLVLVMAPFRWRGERSSGAAGASPWGNHRRRQAPARSGHRSGFHFSVRIPSIWSKAILGATSTASRPAMGGRAAQFGRLQVELRVGEGQRQSLGAGPRGGEGGFGQAVAHPCARVPGRHARDAVLHREDVFEDRKSQRTQLEAL